MSEILKWRGTKFWASRCSHLGHFFFSAQSAHPKPKPGSHWHHKWPFLYSNIVRFIRFFGFLSTQAGEASPNLLDGVPELGFGLDSVVPREALKEEVPFLLHRINHPHNIDSSVPCKPGLHLGNCPAFPLCPSRISSGAPERWFPRVLSKDR